MLDDGIIDCSIDPLTGTAMTPTHLRVKADQWIAGWRPNLKEQKRDAENRERAAGRKGRERREIHAEFYSQITAAADRATRVRRLVEKR
jgi:hypothetical protein